MKTITVWAGSDIFASIQVPTSAHSSDRAYLGGVIHDALDVFGEGVELRKITETRYEIDTAKCGS